ncbi:MAG: 4Fe-4S binding protein [Candidatus Omnitrophica bacterium]|nr:4Fe-4S binding protein [Candidatus Omnitrophota bacterium]
MTKKNKIVKKFEVVIEKDKCKGCGLCITYCPTKHLLFSKDLNKRGLKYAKVNQKNKCIGCGACFIVCPDVAIKIYAKE